MNIINKYKNMNVQVKAAFWYTFCNFLQNGIAFLVIPVYANMLTTAEYGRWNVFQSWRDILIIFASLNLHSGVFAKTLVDIKDDRDKYTSCMQGLGTVITSIILGIYLVFHKLADGYFGFDRLTVVLLFLYFISFPAFQFWCTRQRVEYKYTKMVVFTIILSIFTPGLSIALLVWGGLREQAVIYGYLISQVSIGLIFYVYHFIKGKCFYDKGYWRYALKFNIPLIPHYLSLIVLGQADRIMIRDIEGEAESGIYSFGYQLSIVVTVLISAINGARVPWTYEQLRDKVYAPLRSVSALLCVLIASITLAIALLSPDVITIMSLGNGNYTAAKYVIPVVALGLYFTFVYDLFCSIEFYYSATKYVMVASTVGALLNILLNWIFINLYGFIAAAYTTLVCYIVLMLMHFVFMRRVIKDQKIEERVYDYKMIFGISFLLILLMAICMLSYISNISRYLLLLVLLIIVVIKRKTIMSIFNQMKGQKS